MNLNESMQIESLRMPLFRKSEAKVSRLPAKEIARMVIRASSERHDWIKKNVKSREFILADIPLTSAAVVNSDGNIDLKASIDEKPLVVDINKNKVGVSPGRKTKYIPPVIVIEGSARHNAARMKGQHTVKAWVGAEAAVLMGLMADHQFGAQELQDKLSELLREQLVPKKKNGDYNSLGPSPWIREVYPYENYFIYSYEGKLYKQKFTTDLKKREVSFDGDPEQVIQKYVDLSAQSPMEKAIRMTPMGNKPTTKGGFTYNATAPGTGVGPRVEVKQNPRSEFFRNK